MDANLEKNTVTIFGKKEKLDTLATKLAGLRGEQVYSTFAYRGILIPKRLNCLALFSVINEKLKGLYATDLSKDYFQRLVNYKNFCELELYNLFIALCDNKDDFKKYRINLFKLILINYASLNLMDGEINYLKGVKKLSVEKFPKYFEYISAMCTEQKNTFDGQDINVLIDTLADSASNQEIVDLSLKYGIRVPTSLKKNELFNFMMYYMKKNNTYTQELEAELKEYTLADLNKYCKKKNIPMSSSVNKTELVNYFFYILSQCEIVTTPVNRIIGEDVFGPLDITVDLTVFKGFSKDNSKRVIHYPNDEDDEFIPRDEEGNILVIKEEVVEEVKEEPEVELDDESLVDYYERILAESGMSEADFAKEFFGEEVKDEPKKKVYKKVTVKGDSLMKEYNKLLDESGLTEEELQEMLNDTI